MIILEHNDPKFVVTKDIILACLDGRTVALEQDDPISVYKTESGDKIFIGDIGDTLEIRDSRIAEMLLNNIHPSDFELSEDDDLEVNEGSEHLKPRLLEVDMTSIDKMARVALASEEIVSKKHIIVNSIL